jgi:pimeloyl-ACP methyl ester carboxylesterase
MATARINGIDVHYEDTGGGGPVVLFSHGFLMDHTMFDRQVDALADHYRCIRWEERGFGATRADGPFTYWDSADDAIALLDHVGVDEAVFVGMSQGGFLSLRAALTHPARVRAIVLIDSAADVDDAETLAGYQACSMCSSTDPTRNAPVCSRWSPGSFSVTNHWPPSGSHAGWRSNAVSSP